VDKQMTNPLTSTRHMGMLQIHKPINYLKLFQKDISH